MTPSPDTAFEAALQTVSQDAVFKALHVLTAAAANEEGTEDPFYEALNEIRRYASAIWNARGAADAWQPIETAPKDGRQLILLLTPSGFPQVGYSNSWWTAGFSVECKPTHWMPLPAPPLSGG